MIKVENLKKTYPGQVSTHALKGVSFEIAEGEFVAVMGRSGSGKSTMLHQLGLIDTPSEGRIFVDGTNVLDLSDGERLNFGFENWVTFFKKMPSFMN